MKPFWQISNSFWKDADRENDGAEKLPGLPIHELTEQTAAALEELKHFRSRQCAERVDRMLLHELPEDIGKRLLQIRDQLRLYEDDNAEDLLSQLLSILKKEEEVK